MTIAGFKNSGTAGGLIMSAIVLQLSDATFDGQLAPYPGDLAFSELKERNDVFVYRRRSAPENEQMLVIQLDAGAAHNKSVGACVKLRVQDYLSPLARLIQQRLPQVFPDLSLESTRWSLSRSKRDEDIIDHAFASAGLKRPPSLNALRKHHRTEFKVRHEFVPGCGHTLLLTVEFDREFVIDGSALDLLNQGFQLDGLDVYQPSTPRRWATVRARDGVQLKIVERDGESAVNAAEWFLEPSAQSFQTLFGQFLGRLEFERYENAEWAQRADTMAGKGYVDRLSKWVRYFQNRGPFAVTPSLTVKAFDVLSLSSSGRDASATRLQSPRYCFSADRRATHVLPYEGIAQHGPFDNRTFSVKEPRLLIVCPSDARNDVDVFVRRLLEGLGRDSKKRFIQGMRETYRLHRILPRFATVDLPRVSERIGPRYVEVLQSAFDPGRRPDIVLVVVRDEDAFVERDNPYLAAKAYLLGQGIPSQEMRLTKIRSRMTDLPYILEDVAVAMYAKLGGCPWTIEPSMPLTKEVILGMAWAEFGERHSPGRRFMSVTTVFTSDGTYLLATGSPRCTFEEYPTMLARSVRDLLTRLRKEQGWGEGDIVRLVFHAPKPLTGKETEAIVAIALGALGKEVQFESAFLTVEKSHPFKVVDTRANGQMRFVELARGGHGQALVAECVPERGTVVDLGRKKRLLCVNGPSLVRREGESIPQPLQIELHPASTYKDLAALTRQVFHFTGLSWRSMRPVTEPVTIAYSRWIAALLGRLDRHPGWRDDLLDTHLRTSRWFL